jgi:hypothetical protein
MMYTISQSIEHNRNFLEGYLVGFYHNPNAKVGDQCFNGEINDEYAFIMKVIFE